MEEFLKEEVDLDSEMPKDVRSWKQNSKVTVRGHKGSKTVTRTCKLNDGSEKVVTKTINIAFQI